ncbi:MAG: aspartate kinase [Actinomycetota bacterium]|nr:aspartate kinase [Euzebyaceae bacterium]MDQ3453359.1 aspartate kinase [Actinomycetota bacterium]
MIVVQKYGGSSVADTDRIKRVAERVVQVRRDGHDVVVVVSAMGKTTDQLIRQAEEVSGIPPARELDMLLTAGERISMSLLAMAMHELGYTARSLTGSQAGIITDTTHGKARIIDITPGRINSALAEGHVVIVAGFQGVSRDSKDVTTLGRGGSDTTAVALAGALGASVCEIYTDVDGVYTADPRIVSTARKLQRVSHEEMLELAACGAKVLQVRSVEYARNHHVAVHVRSSFSYGEGTWVQDESEANMEQAVISGVAHDTGEGKLVIRRVPDKPGVAARIFTALAEANINIDMIVQNVSEDGTTDISCTVPLADGPRADLLLTALLPEIGAEGILFDSDVAKVSLVGAGMKTHPGVAAAMFSALSDAGVNIEMISTSTIRISVVVRAAEVSTAVQAVHDRFNLGGEVET